MNVVCNQPGSKPFSIPEWVPNPVYHPPPAAPRREDAPRTPVPEKVPEKVQSRGSRRGVFLLCVLWEFEGWDNLLLAREDARECDSITFYCDAE